MNKFVPLSLLSLIFLNLNAQYDKNVENNQLTLNFLLPGMVYEAGISQNATLTAEATIGFVYSKTDIFWSNEGYGIYPIGKLQYRYYYNFQRRLGRKKRISGNTGNYLAPTFGVQGGKAVIGNLDYSSDYFVGIGAVYGIQRTAPKGFQFRLEAGPAYMFDEFEHGLGLMLAVKLGWVIRKR